MAVGWLRGCVAARCCAAAGGASQRTQGQGWQGLAGARSRSPLLYIAYEPVG
jgi:hypothetical protein